MPKDITKRRSLTREEKKAKLRAKLSEKAKARIYHGTPSGRDGAVVLGQFSGGLAAGDRWAVEAYGFSQGTNRQGDDWASIHIKLYATRCQGKANYWLMVDATTGAIKPFGNGVLLLNGQDTSDGVLAKNVEGFARQFITTGQHTTLGDGKAKKRAPCLADLTGD